MAVRNLVANSKFVSSLCVVNMQPALEQVGIRDKHKAPMSSVTWFGEKRGVKYKMCA
jgi:hypothetical protein